MEFVIKLKAEELDYIGSLLYKRPYEEVNGLIENLKNQVESQKLQVSTNDSNETTKD